MPNDSSIYGFIDWLRAKNIVLSTSRQNKNFQTEYGLFTGDTGVLIAQYLTESHPVLETVHISVPEGLEAELVPVEETIEETHASTEEPHE